MGRHSRRVPGAATLPPQGAILERDTFQTGTLGREGVKLERDTFQSGILE
jgi:hypothetical protein